VSAAAPVAAPAPPPVRVRLLDRMGAATLRVPGDAASPPAATTAHALDFDARAPERIWLGRVEDRRVSWSTDDAGVRVDPAGGLAGAGLVIGPNVPADSRAAFVLPGAPLARVRVSGRVRLEHNPMAGEASSREVLRVIETDEEPSEEPRLSRTTRGAFGASHRVSRTLDPGGWDRFEATFLSRADTQALVIELLHPSAAAETLTRFDDLSLETTPLTPAEIFAGIRADHRPRDGSDTPWRLRVELPAEPGAALEARDCVLLPPPGELALPLELPAAETGPRLVFAYGMAPEAQRVPGDGARIAVCFREPAGDTPLAAFELDPKNERTHRAWLHAEVDLAPVAGRSGALVFATSDVGTEPPDALDAVLIATPRIEPTRNAPAGTNVLLIGIDTLRPDRMSVFGYGRPTTPHLERLAARGVRFTHARAQAPWTLPAFSSIMTSLYPSSHGAGRGGHDEWTPIDPTTTALAEVLARNGWRTQGIVANGLISPEYGLDQGFEAYRWGWAFESAGEDADAVARFVASSTQTPWFLFWHIMEPHLPYNSASEVRARFAEAGYDGRFSGGQVPFQVLDPRPGRRWFTHEGPPPAPELSDADRRFVNDAYDAEIAETDAAIGRVLAALEESGQLERTIVALIADHGEGLGDHDHYHHGYTLFEDQVRVPMLVVVPGGPAGVTIERAVAAIDLAPTLLGALGLPQPASFRGVDLLADEKDGASEQPYFIEYPTYDSSAQKAWVLGRFKYLHDPVFHTEALYDLAADPRERTDVAAEHPELVARARAELAEFRWSELQPGRFHLRVQARAGARLRLVAGIDDLFDANFACRPPPPERDFEMDLERRRLVLDTTLAKERLELVFWGRGAVLDLTLELDGRPAAIALAGEEPAPAPVRFATADLPERLGADLGWPPPGQALLWLEAGAENVQPVVPTPEELERLRELGYVR
jgi:arylsulfatase A-like enzyme